jgi:hypothetical protein
MSVQKIAPQEQEGFVPEFDDELSDEALDRAETLSHPGCQNLCPVFPSAPDR